MTPREALIEQLKSSCQSLQRFNTCVKNAILDRGVSWPFITADVDYEVFFDRFLEVLEGRRRTEAIEVFRALAHNFLPGARLFEELAAGVAQQTDDEYKLRTVIEDYFRSEVPSADSSVASVDQIAQYVESVLSTSRHGTSALASLLDPQKIFVQLDCQPLGNTDQAVVNATSWLKAAKPNRGRLMLADYGAGKSFLALKVFLDLADNYVRNAGAAPLPVLLPLRKHAMRDADPHDSLIENVFSAMPSPKPLCEDFDDFKKLLVDGRLFVILDAVDEIPYVCRRRPELVLDWLRISYCGSSPWIVTSRSGLFAGLLAQKHASQAFNGYEVARLLRWGDGQWQDYVAHCDLNHELFGDEAAERRRNRELFMKTIADSSSLRQLPSTPLYARMLVEMWPRIVERRQDLDVLGLFTEYTDAVLADKVEPDTLSPNVMPLRRGVLECLAASFHDPARAEPTCTKSQLYSAARACLLQTGDEQLQDFLDSASLDRFSLLRVISEDDIAFSHDAFREYFLAIAVVNQIRVHGWAVNEPMLQQRLLTEGEARFVARILDQPDNKDLRSKVKALLREGAASEIGHLKVLRANLLRIGVSQSDVDLSKADLEELNLGDVSLRREDGKSVNLTGAKLCGTQATGADFSGADLSECDLTGAQLRECVFAGTRLIDVVSWRRCMLKDVVVTERLPVLAGSDFEKLNSDRSSAAYFLLAVQQDPTEDEAWRSKASAELARLIANVD